MPRRKASENSKITFRNFSLSLADSNRHKTLLTSAAKLKLYVAPHIPVLKVLEALVGFHAQLADSIKGVKLDSFWPVIISTSALEMGTV